MTELERRYRAFADRTLPADAPPTQRHTLRMAFYLGALAGAEVQLDVIKQSPDEDLATGVTKMHDDLISEVKAEHDRSLPEWFRR